MSDYVKIEQADNAAIADLIKQRLDQGGIPCVLVPSDIAVVAGAGASYAAHERSGRRTRAAAEPGRRRRPRFALPPGTWHPGGGPPVGSGGELASAWHVDDPTAGRWALERDPSLSAVAVGKEGTGRLLARVRRELTNA